jgi:hypothetical protein
MEKKKKMRIALKHIGQKHKEKPQSMGSTPLSLTMKI